MHAHYGVVVAGTVQLDEEMILYIVKCGPADGSDSILRHSGRRKGEHGNLAALELLRSLTDEVHHLVVLVGDDDASRIPLLVRLLLAGAECDLVKQ